MGWIKGAASAEIPAHHKGTSFIAGRPGEMQIRVTGKRVLLPLLFYQFYFFKVRDGVIRALSLLREINAVGAGF